MATIESMDIDLTTQVQVLTKERDWMTEFMKFYSDLQIDYIDENGNECEVFDREWLVAQFIEFLNNNLTQFQIDIFVNNCGLECFDITYLENIWNRIKRSIIADEDHNDPIEFYNVIDKHTTNELSILSKLMRIQFHNYMDIKNTNYHTLIKYKPMDNIGRIIWFFYSGISDNFISNIYTTKYEQYLQYINQDSNNIINNIIDNKSDIIDNTGINNDNIAIDAKINELSSEVQNSLNI